MVKGIKLILIAVAVNLLIIGIIFAAARHFLKG